MTLQVSVQDGVLTIVKKCNKDLKTHDNSHNLTQTPIDYDCDCKNKWLAEVNNADMNKSAVPVKTSPIILKKCFFWYDKKYQI